MKVLTLVRHAKSSWDFPQLDDFDRPLNKRGKRDAPEMARRLARANYVPDLIVSSPAKRAFTTATILAEALGIDPQDIVRDESMYLASASHLAEVVTGVGKKADHLMLFGHNPGFTEFANKLSDARIDNLPTSGVLSVQFAIDDWRDFKQRKGDFLFFDYPKNDESVIPTGPQR